MASEYPSAPDSTVVAIFAANLDVLDLDHQAWNNSHPINITRYWSGAEAPIARHAEVRLCWNKSGLLARFVCNQHEPLVISDTPVTERKTLGLWDRDVCEIFIAPDPGKPTQYFEFEAAPTGEWIDLAIHLTSSGRKTEWDFMSGMRSAVQLQTELIKIGVLIPWSERIPLPVTGAEWKVNLFRCVGTEEATRYLAWRPTLTPEPNFHVPEAFGVLQFS